MAVDEQVGPPWGSAHNRVGQTLFNGPLHVHLPWLAPCRDLKLDNTLLDNHSPPWLKLCDFGFAKHWQVRVSAGLHRVACCALGPTCSTGVVVAGQVPWPGSQACSLT